MPEKLLLELILLLLGCLLGLMAWLCKRHDTQHREMQADIAAVRHQRLECGASFATKGAMERAHARIDENEAHIHDLSTRVTRLESCSGRALGGHHEL